ncbi:MAG: RNA 2',3'-cyclic phosphodiesterase [Desulfopila sp.]|jgi:2'-5' RNA ligase|nr:RNA 2',3'-cyclic phosphodiesterase [Desulfopila sp.]
MIRLFTAIPLPEQITPFLHAMGRSLPGAKAVPEDQIHVTLRFIGEVEGGLYHDIRESLAEVASEPFQLAIRGVGHFPPRGKPRVLWAGLEPVDQLIALKRRIDTTLIQCGLPPDSRKYTPHVTLARLSNTPLNRLTSFLAGNAFLEFDTIAVNCFNLYSSKLSPKGAIHSLEASYSLLVD